jgi:hypothetical protein
VIDEYLLICNVHLSTLFTQQLHNHPLIDAQRNLAANGEVEGSLQLVVDSVDVSSVSDKKPYHVQISRLAGEMQCRSTVDDFGSTSRNRNHVSAAPHTVGSVVVRQLLSVVGISSTLSYHYRPILNIMLCHVM